MFETYWTRRRGAEAMDYNYALMDLTVYGRQEGWEDSPPAGHKPTSTRSADGPPAWDTNTDVDVACWTAYRPVVPAGRRTL